MKTIAYLANQYPNCIETYVSEEIEALRNRGVVVLACSVFSPQPQSSTPKLKDLEQDTLYLSRVRARNLLRALLLSLARFGVLWTFCSYALWRENEPLPRRLKALLHTLVGAYFGACLLDEQVDHIHVHHGFFGAWVAMVAARMLRIGYSMTLHGSDLLVHHAFLDIKLRNCDFCYTVSEYNREFILRNYPAIDRSKLLLRRLGVATPTCTDLAPVFSKPRPLFVVLSVGRLHAVKNYKFLIDAIAVLKSRGIAILCLIAGEGPERQQLESQIAHNHLHREVKLLGHVAREDLESVYAMVDIVALTSVSEGLPVSLMEAMSYGCIVLAPAMTGLPELVVDETTGFLYEANSLESFVSRLKFIARSLEKIHSVRNAAQEYIHTFFDRDRNLQAFVDSLLQRISPRIGVCREDPVLQQI